MLPSQGLPWPGTNKVHPARSGVQSEGKPQAEHTHAPHLTPHTSSHTSHSPYIASGSARPTRARMLDRTSASNLVRMYRHATHGPVRVIGLLSTHLGPNQTRSKWYFYSFFLPNHCCMYSWLYCGKISAQITEPIFPNLAPNFPPCYTVQPDTSFDKTLFSSIVRLPIA